MILGVSLAFYVSSSSEQQKEEREVNQILISLVDELAEDQESFSEYQIPVQEKQSAIISKVLVQLMTGDLDSLSERIEMAINVNNNSPIDLTFKSITSSGKLDLIRGFELKKEISYYYESLAIECEFRNQAQTDFFMDRILPWLITNTNLVASDEESLIENQEFINLLIIYKGFVDNKLRHYKVIEVESEKLKNRLKSMVNNGE